MNEYVATEQAFKNGYNKAVEDFADKARTVVYENVEWPSLIVRIYKVVDRIEGELLGKD